MSLRFSLIGGKELPVQQGLPGNYDGPVLQGAKAYYINGEFGYAVMQQVRINHISINKVLINWKRPERIICEHNYPPVVFCRNALNRGFYEVIKGLGDTLVNKEQFVVHTGKNWSELLISEKPGEHNFIDMIWSPEFLNEPVIKNNVTSNTIENYTNDLAKRLTAVPHSLNADMKMIIKDIHSIDFNSTYGKQSFSALMLRYLDLIFNEIKEQHSIKRIMGDSDWYTINRARQLIDENPAMRISTPELSVKIGINEYKLKKLFPKLTGYAVDEYRKYKLFSHSAGNIIKTPHMPLKIVAMEAGYYNLATFIRAFKNLRHCTPGELREDSWDVSRIKTRVPEIN